MCRNLDHTHLKSPCIDATTVTTLRWIKRLQEKPTKFVRLLHTARTSHALSQEHSLGREGQVSGWKRIRSGHLAVYIGKAEGTAMEQGRGALLNLDVEEPGLDTATVLEFWNKERFPSLRVVHPCNISLNIAIRLSLSEL